MPGILDHFIDEMSCMYMGSKIVLPISYMNIKCVHIQKC